MNKKDKFLHDHLTGRNRPSSDEYLSVVRTDEVSTSVAIRPDGFRRDLSIEERGVHKQRPDDANMSIKHADESRPKRSPVELSLIGLFNRPWSYYWKWVFVLGVVLSIGMYFLSLALPSSITKLSYAIAMAICVPAATVCLVSEWDITRRVNWLVAIIVTLLCGGVSASIAGLMNSYLNVSTNNAWMAALTEEPIKGAMLLIMLFMTNRFPGILSGLALGCAVGAGFAINETVDYAYAFSADDSPSVTVLVVRGFLSPMMHMAWTGALGGALWTSRGINGDWMRVIFSWLSWLVFAGMIFCHAMWNAVGAVYLLVIGLWVLILYFVRRGVAQAFLLNLVSGKDAQ